VSCYEKLRSCALGQPVEPGARGGLALLLSRGMWQWAQVIAAEPPKHDAVRSAGGAVPLERSPDLIRLLAEMTLASTRRAL